MGRKEKEANRALTAKAHHRQKGPSQSRKRVDISILCVKML